MSCSRTQRSDAGDDGTSSPSISSQALYHLATAFPYRLIGLRHKVPVNNISVMPGLLTERGRKKKKIQWDILKCPDPHPNLPQMKQISSCQQSHLSESSSRECTTPAPEKSSSIICTVNEVITIVLYIPKLSYPKIFGIQSFCTGPHSTVGNVSGNRCESDCRSRGRKFNPGPSHTFVEIDHEIIFTVILLPSAESFKKGCC